MADEGVDQRFNQIKQSLDSGETVSTTTRDFLRWFGAQRRGTYIVQDIRRTLEKYGLSTNPDFEGAYIDGTIKIIEKPQSDTTNSSAPTQYAADPTYRIGKLPSANKKPTSVAPGALVSQAVTLMLTNDFSQLPVMSGDRNPRGMVSWSSIGSRLALGRSCDKVDDCMDPHRVINYNTSLFEAIDEIIKNQYVLIEDSQRNISGIVTTSDLSLQFQQLGEPFLLIGEIENYVRRMLSDKFSGDELAEVRDPDDGGRSVERVEDLTFGEYIRLIENPSRWEALGLGLDRKEFIAKLDHVRNIRNDIMHFDPDGISEDDLVVLRQVVNLLQRLAGMKAI